jgi:high affinity Mn2+ porin
MFCRRRGAGEKGMTRAYLSGAVALAAVTLHGPAAGADMPTKIPGATPQSPSPFDWTGFYFGGHLGYATGRSSFVAMTTGPSTPPLSGSVDMFNSFDAFKGSGSFFEGVQGGYNYMLPSRLLFGIEADISPPNTIAGTRGIASPLIGQASYTDTLLGSGTARGRIGYAFGHWLAYVTGGFAWTYDQLARTQLADVPIGGSAGEGAAESAFLWRFGWAAGAGIEVSIASNWTAKLEYLFSDFGRSGVTFPAAGQRFDSDLLMQSVRVGFNYQLGNDLADGFPKGSSALDLDNFSIHGQTTFVSQYAFPFHAPYHGAQSLDSNSGRETWDLSLFLGIRPWEGGELWIDPEIDQGFGLSGTFGVAGFPSAEAYKVGSSYPYARVPRMFLRQTIDLGGDTQKVVSDINQFAGSQTADRLVITIGKISVVDIFDANAYAHDPRSDFLNWTAIDTAAFDYAADAWAFTYGGAIEWYKDQWTLRAGVFDAPVVPNSTDLDPTFHQFQMVGEVERRYDLAGQPGKLAVTGYLTRARMGNFDAAIELAQLTGGPADIAAVRTYTTKSGIAGNLEQQIIPDVGMFIRAGWTPGGKLEPDAFTDADASLSGGFSLGGKLWGRPDDHIGLAGILNTISSSHEAYFDAGGLTALLGDGTLPHPGPEKIMEAFYRLPVFSWQATLDYQFIVNPAYNRDRGPVSVVATRLHTQF